MTQDTLRIGLIGAGGNVRSRHIPGFREQANVEIVSVANRTRASGQAIADEFGIAKVCDGWEEVLADPGVDAVCIGTWPYMHRTLTMAALEAGKHVMCEARMAMNLSDGEAMLAASRKRPALVAQIVPAPHTLAFDQTIQGMIADGYVGDVIGVDARIAAARAYPDARAPVHWRHDRDLSGNNVMNMGIWYEAMMRWVGQMKTVMAVGQRVVNLDEILTKVTSSQITPPLSYNSAEVQNPTGLSAPHCPEGKIPGALSAVAMKCMAYDSDERYMFVEALQADVIAGVFASTFVITAIG